MYKGKIGQYIKIIVEEDILMSQYLIISPITNIITKAIRKKLVKIIASIFTLFFNRKCNHSFEEKKNE